MRTEKQTIEYQKAYYQKNKERIKARIERYKQQHPDKVKISKKKYAAKNKDKIKEWQKNWRTKNQEKVRKYQRNWMKDYYKTNEGYRLKRKKYNKEYATNNKESIRKQAKKWYWKNREERLAYNRRPKNLLKNAARTYDRKHKRQKECMKCSSTQKLHFHHTDYVKREGYTVCQSCHVKVHKRQDELERGFHGN